MLRTISSNVLVGILILVSTRASLSAQTPGVKYPGADLFERGWKSDQGTGTPINIPEAIRSYRAAVALGNPLAKARLARIYFSGNGVVADQREAARMAKGVFPEVLKAAEQNDAVSQMIVGTMYADGLGVARDGDEALRWLRKAADENVPMAQANLGVAYENGIGVPLDLGEAVKWYRMAATQGSAIGQAYLGDLYRAGRGVPHDDVEGARLYQLSAKQNFAHAQNNLGYMYDHGCVVGHNPWEAARLYRLAAEQNFAIAQTNLGTMYEHGSGVTQNLDEAVKWYRRVQPLKAIRTLFGTFSALVISHESIDRRFSPKHLIQVTGEPQSVS